MALAEHLETVPPAMARGGRRFHEMDVEAILARKPQVVLVDELAHTNADGSKNDKRYSDVLEVLAQGINVISTINVQHLESVAARVEEATGIAVRERIPDTVLRRADQVVNVDVTKEELRERLRQGKIYAPQQAERALSSFFTYENLSFLRELCLREASGDQVRKIEAQELLKPALAGYAVEAVMVALSSWPTDAESLIRRGVRMANQLGSPCYVVYVRRPQESPTRIDAGIQRQLQHNLQLATRLGAEVVQLEGVDIAETLVNFASERNVRHAIFGKSRLSPLRERLRGSFLLDFLYEAVGVDVHVATSPRSISSERVMIVLPTMHKRIRRSFLRLVLLLRALGVLMVTGITIAGRVPSELIRMNYDSIAYAQEMVRAMNGIRFPELYRDTDTLGWEKRFADTLEQASGNITEEAERKVITDLQASWDAYRQTPDDANYRGLHARIDALVQVNERGMFLRLSKNARFRDIMMAVTAAAFLLGTFWAFLLADSVAERLAHPLRRVAELFRDRPQLGRKLHLPDPQTLEVRLLFDELSRLWASPRGTGRAERAQAGRGKAEA